MLGHAFDRCRLSLRCASVNLPSWLDARGRRFPSFDAGLPARQWGVRMSRVRAVLVFPALLTFLLAFTGGVQSSPGNGNARVSPPGQAFVPGEILIKFQPNARAEDRANARAQLGASHIRTFHTGAEHWRLGKGVSVEEALGRMKGNPHVKYAEPNYIITADLIPDDPRFPEMWGLNNTGQTGGTPDADIDAPEAWTVSQGSSNVLVGVIDTGVDYNHPDLAANIWTNPGEIPGNGIDDDGNGFVDDVHGYDFYNNDGDPFDDNGHGTHTSGTIGAVGNNGIGVTGVNWHVKIMALKFLSSGGSGSTDGAVRAVEYSTMMGVHLTSNSWGGGGFSQTLYDAIADAGAHDIPFVVAAGNSSANVDTSPTYPCSYDLASIICVAATDHNDALASFSNFGAVGVDLGAPGVDILSTLPGNSYGVYSGTSMATPHVAGVAALIKSLSPTIPVAQLKSVLMNSGDSKPALNGKTVSGKRLNAFFAIAEPDTVPPAMIADLAASGPGSNTMVLTWTATGDDGTTGTAAYYEVRFSTSPIDESTWASATRAGNEPNPQPSGAAEMMQVGGLTASTTYTFAIKAFDEWGNPSPISNLATGTTLPPPIAQVEPTSISDDLLTGQTADHTIVLSNIGPGTLDFRIPMPTLGEPMSVPQDPLFLGKDDPDPRQGDPVTAGAGGPDPFGYRWVDSDQAGGPLFSWVEISGTGTAVEATGDDSTSPAIPLGFDFPFYGTFFNSIRVCSNGFLSFTSSSTAYSNQPLPNSGAPENLVAPFWDDLNPGGATHIYFQSFGDWAVVEWTGMPAYSGGGTYTFQAILGATGAVTYQYLSMGGPVNSATVGIQNAAKTVGLQVAFNQAYLHDNLAVRIAAIPQWLTVPTYVGRIGAGQSMPIGVHVNAAGLEGGTYPGQIHIETNDPGHPLLTVDVSLHITGAPDVAAQPASLGFGDSFLGLPKTLALTVANTGTDTLHVTDIVPSAPELAVSPSVIDIPPHGSQSVVVTWTPSLLGPFTGSLTIQSNAVGHPSLVVPVAGNAIPAPVAVVNPISYDETLYSGYTVTRNLNVTNAGGSDLVITAASDLGISGTGLVSTDPSILGQGGPDAFGYRWRDSDAPGGPAFSWVDISTTGTAITFSSLDDSVSAAIPLGLTFPFYGNNYSQIRVSTNGWLTFDTTYSSSLSGNYTLPSTSGAPSMIALFWDDLHLRVAGRVRYLNDGTRFILQYTNVDKYSPSGASLTFQVQLYPNGRIVLQYLTMTGTLNSATIGIQNQARNVGLAVNYNTSYVHNNLAIALSRTPDWLSVTPAGATIPPGGSQDFSVKFDATDRPGGTLSGKVVLGTNIPSQPQILVPATLHVIGAPQIRLIPTSYAYGTVFVGYSQLTSFLVLNNGTDVLNIANLTTTDPNLFVEEPPEQPGGGPGTQAAFPLPPGASRVFNLRWLPPAAGPLSAQVRVQSDDPVTPIATLAVTGNAIVAPVAVHSPASFTEAMNAGEVLTRTLHLENQGGSNLTFGTAVRALSGTPVPVYNDQELKKDEIDPKPGILGTGGPDLFGYTWKDSDQPAGPAFSWVDISATGTAISFSSPDDANAGPIPIGFPFPFYGNTFSTVNVCTNGWLSFTNTGTSLSNAALPNTGAPENLIALFWDDLHLRSGNVKYLNDGSRFILQYTNVDKYTPSGGSLTFQVILYPNGRIVYQYLTMTTSDLLSATVGIQNQAMNDGLTVVYNAAYMHNNLSVEFRPPLDFLSISPTDGTIPPGGFADLQVRIDATNLIGGDYGAGIDLTTNDPARGLITVPLSLHVTGIPDIDAAPPSLAFPTTFIGVSASLPLSIRNVGSDVLHISGASIDGDFAFTGLTPPVHLAPGAAAPLLVQFAPTAPGLRTGVLTIQSDDPDEPAFTVPLQGEGLVPPVATVDPASMTEAMNVGEIHTRTLRLTNQGGSDLTFGTAIRAMAGPAVPVYDFLDLKKDETDPRPGIRGGGGPDLFGYTWKDSDQPGGPAFSWFDISGIGTPLTALTGDDAIVTGVPIGFPFPFYGNTFSTVNVTTNGFLSFTSTAFYFANQPLPNTGAPENLLAPFWDDLDFYGVPHVYTYGDGSRFIVQYNDVSRHYYPAPSEPDHMTFQVILYPSGRIVYQYLTMTATLLDSATIGIQNQAKNDGLQVVYDLPYVHDNLAVAFSLAPEWVTVSPTDGTIPAGGFADLQVRIDATGLIGGDYSAGIDITNNDPFRGLISVPLALHVTGIPDIDAAPPSLTFPTTFVGFSAPLPLSIRNVGTDVLHISGATISGDFAFTGLTPPASLVVDGVIPLTVQFVPTAAGLRTGVLTIQSDDPDEPAFTVLLQGQALIPPVIGSDPASLHTALPPGGTRTKTLNLCNTGGSDLIWTLGTNLISGQVTPYPAIELAKDEPDPRVGILGSGGPDLFGYKWKDSDEPGGPTFSFADIRTTGMPVTFTSPDDAYAGPFNLGMSFPYYGNMVSQVWVSTNGWVTFSAPSSSDYSNDPLPNSGAPGNLLALFWDDLHLRSGDVRYLYDGSRFILQFTNIDKYSPSGGSLTFQVILYPSGKILYQYLTMTSSALDSATIGIQNAGGTDGLTVVYDAAYVHDNLAVEFSLVPDWLIGSPAGGTIPAGGCQIVTLNLKAAGLGDGLHQATLDFASNDPYHPLMQVPVELMIGLTPVTYLNFDPDSLNGGSMGKTVKVVLELPPEYDPHNIDVSSIRLNDTVPAILHPVDFTDENHNGIPELVVKFDRAAVEAVLSPGSEAPVWVQGEVTDTTWFRGTTTVRVIQPQVTHPNGGEFFVLGGAVTVSWDPVAWPGSVLYDVYLSRDDGNSWELLAANLADTSVGWVASGSATLQGRIRVIAKDGQGMLGYDTSNADFTIAATLMAPYGVGNTLALSFDGTSVNLTWKRPASDLTHGPAERYRVQRSLSLQGPFQEIGTVTTESFHDPAAGTDGAGVVYYRIVANNGAGDSTD